MTLVKKIRKRGGTNLIVTANAEILFNPNSEISRWNNSVSQRMRYAIGRHAPTNKRHRWSHNGVPLRKSIKAATDLKVLPGQGGMAYFAVGSNKPYALFVDQGTQSFEAKILPPWRPGSPSLYEHTWKVPEVADYDNSGRAIIQWNEVGKIRVRGQRARNFFAAGLDEVMRRDIGVEINELGKSIVGQTRTFPERLAQFVTTGYNGDNPAFMANLEQWRIWRDSAFSHNIPLGENRPLTVERERREAIYNRKRASRQAKYEADSTARSNRRRENRREAQARYRRRQGQMTRAEYRRNNEQVKERKSAQARDRAFQAAGVERAKWLRAHPGYRISGSNSNGFFVVDAKGNRFFRVWSPRVGELFLDAGFPDSPLPAGTRTIR